MKTVRAYEFKDLLIAVQNKAKERAIDTEVEMRLNFLQQDYEKGLLTEDEFYNEMGCSKYYADTTAWFVPSCYYEKNKEEIDKAVDEYLNASLFDSMGTIVWLDVISQS